MGYLIVAVLLMIFLMPTIGPLVKRTISEIRRRVTPRKDLDIFDNSYIEAKAFYLKEFNRAPCVTYVSNVESTKVFEYISKGNAGRVLTTYQSNYYSWQHKKQFFSRTIFKLEGKVMIELGHDYAEIFFSNDLFDYADKLMEVFVGFKAADKEEEYEINIITYNAGNLELKQLEIKPTPLDIGLFYNDDFAKVDKLIKERLAKEGDKGIVLLHGLPGTGKTTYLRHLIGSIKKKVLFVSPSVAGNLMNPEFIDLLIDNPNAVLVIEDAENIIMDRKYSSNSSVSNLLNISDGLLSDCLNVQIICTFNSHLNMVDTALLRKGRLIAEYEFGKLEVTKGQRLSDHLGLDQRITRPMTLAEITNPEEIEYQATKVNVIGFRRMEEVIEN
jgi:hypothetical protein